MNNENYTMMEIDTSIYRSISYFKRSFKKITKKCNCCNKDLPLINFINDSDLVQFYYSKHFFEGTIKVYNISLACEKKMIKRKILEDKKKKLEYDITNIIMEIINKDVK